MEITQEWVDALERYDVTIEEWERSPDSPFGAGEAGDLVERREAFVDRWDGYDCAGSAFDVVRWRTDELTYPKSIGEYVVERIANEDWRRCVLRRSRASRAWVAVQSSGNRLVADDSIDPEDCVSVNTNISEA